MDEEKNEALAGHDAHRADLAHYWTRLMWYRDELWRITTPVWAVYGAFLASIVGYVWSAEHGGCENRISAQVALMLLFGIATLSWVIFRVYWVYACCIYAGIEKLNRDIQDREQHIYNTILSKLCTADYGCFRVRPRLNVLFTVVGVTMMMACMFTVAASIKFKFVFNLKTSGPCDPSAEPSLMAMHWVVYLCVALVGIFEFFMQKEEKCPICGKVDETISKVEPKKYKCGCEHPKLNVLFTAVGMAMVPVGVLMVAISAEPDFWNHYIEAFKSQFFNPPVHWVVFSVVALVGFIEWGVKYKKFSTNNLFGITQKLADVISKYLGK